MTKLIRLLNIEKEWGLDNQIFAKVENTNPSGSIKDRPVFYMLEEAKRSGLLKENTTIIEATSGNTGISLSYYSSIEHYRAIIVMPLSMSIERRKMITQYGGVLILVEGGMKECQKKALELHQNIENSFIFGQFENLNNPQSHYLTTGPEIYQQCPDIQFLFAGIGTGGTISGTGKYLKEKNPSIHIIGVEPAQSPLLTKGYAHSHHIEGIGANFIPLTLNQKVIDDIVDVDDIKSLEMAKTIRQIEQQDVGISSGAALLGAIQYIKEHDLHHQTMVVIFPDKGDRYSW